jgi:hypothetical protein
LSVCVAVCVEGVVEDPQVQVCPWDIARPLRVARVSTAVNRYNSVHSTDHYAYCDPTVLCDRTWRICIYKTVQLPV